MCQSQVIYRYKLPDFAPPPLSAQRKNLIYSVPLLLSSQLVACRPGSAVTLHKAFSTADKTTRPSSPNTLAGDVQPRCPAISMIASIRARSPEVVAAARVRGPAERRVYPKLACDRSLFVSALPISPREPHFRRHPPHHNPSRALYVRPAPRAAAGGGGLCKPHSMRQTCLLAPGLPGGKRVPPGRCGLPCDRGSLPPRCRGPESSPARTASLSSGCPDNRTILCGVSVLALAVAFMFHALSSRPWPNPQQTTCSWRRAAPGSPVIL